MNLESLAHISVAVDPPHVGHSTLLGFCLRPDNHAIGHPQHGGDEAVIPEATTHKHVCNPQNYTNLLEN